MGPHPAVTLACDRRAARATAGIILAGLVRLVIERGVVLQAVFGALAVYMLVGTHVRLPHRHAGDRRVEPTTSPRGPTATQNARVYFSFTTLTTTGFGDYTAATRAGRALAVLEMLIGQLYLVTVIATLVGNLRHQRQLTCASSR